MKIKKVAPKNKVNNMRNRTYNCCTNLIWVIVCVKAIKNAIENIITMRQIFNRISKNLVSISYCDGMLLNSIFLNIKTL